MTNEQIQVGDLVELKSGGPDMTVEKIYEGANGEQRAACQWFDGVKPMSGAFPLTSLKPASKPHSGPSIAVVSPGFRGR